MTAFDYVAFGAMAVVAVFLVWLIIWLGDLPAAVAEERGHKQVAAVRALSWFGLLFTGGVLWIFAMTWAYYDYAPSSVVGAAKTDPDAQLAELTARVEALEAGREQPVSAGAQPGEIS